MLGKVMNTGHVAVFRVRNELKKRVYHDPFVEQVGVIFNDDMAAPTAFDDLQLANAHVVAHDL